MSMGYDALGSHNLNGNPQIEVNQYSKGEIFSMRGLQSDVKTAAVIDRLRQVFGVKTDTALAAAMGVGKTAPSNWRLRDATPFEMCANVARDRGISLDWLIFGVGQMRPGIEDSQVGGQGIRPRSTQAERILRFVEMWDATKPGDEVVWLEQQLKRAVPEYADWLLTDGRTTN